MTPNVQARWRAVFSPTERHSTTVYKRCALTARNSSYLLMYAQKASKSSRPESSGRVFFFCLAQGHFNVWSGCWVRFSALRRVGWEMQLHLRERERNNTSRSLNLAFWLLRYPRLLGNSVHIKSIESRFHTLWAICPHLTRQENHCIPFNFSTKYCINIFDASHKLTRRVRRIPSTPPPPSHTYLHIQLIKSPGELKYNTN